MKKKKKKKWVLILFEEKKEVITEVIQHNTIKENIIGTIKSKTIIG